MKETLEEENERLRDACIELSGALSRIDYLCGEPNDMEVSDYDLHCNPLEVIKAVERRLKCHYR